MRGVFLLQVYPVPPTVYRYVPPRLLVRVLEPPSDRFDDRGPLPDPCIVEHRGRPGSILGENLLLRIDPDPVDVCTLRGIDLGRAVVLGAVVGGSDECEIVSLVDRGRQFLVGANRDPEPANNDGDEPQPKRTDTLAILIDVVPQVHEGINDGEYEGDDNPRYGCRGGDGPSVSLFKPVNETFPPVVILREDDERCEESTTGGQTQWDLLEVDEGLCSVLVVGVLDGGETVVGPASVDGCEGEGEGGESGGPDGEGDWCTEVRKMVQ